MIDGVVADVRNDELDCLVVASKIAFKNNIPLWWIRKRKEHGLMNVVEGSLRIMKDCDNIVLISTFNKSEVSE